MWENTTPSTELPRDFCAGIGMLQLGVVLVSKTFDMVLHKLLLHELESYVIRGSLIK